MSGNIEKERIFFEVPLSVKALDDLHKIADRHQTTPLRVLREVVDGYQRNGHQPQLPNPSPEDVHRGVPVSHTLLRQLRKMEAESGYSKTALGYLRAILESELDKRARASDT